MKEKKITNPDKLFPRENDRTTCYLKNFITRPGIEVGDYTIYHDFEYPQDFETKNVLYHYPINLDRLVIGKFCSIAHGAKFLLNGSNHTLRSVSTYPFPVLKNEWQLDIPATDAWDNKGDIIIGNDVWIGFEAVILAGVTIGDGSIIASRAVVKKNVAPYSIVGGIPAKAIRKRFTEEEIFFLLQLKWWDWEETQIRENLDAIMNGDIDRLRKIIL